MRSTEQIGHTRATPWNQRGVSLVETMVAISLFAISAATVGEFIVHQTQKATSNHLTSTAQTMAEEEFERLRALDYDDIAGGSTTRTVGSVLFTMTTQVQANTPAVNMKQISVDVGWAAPQGTQHVTVYTIYTAIKR